MDIKEKQARWALEKPLFEAEFIHSHLLPFFTFNENTGDYEIKSECVNNTDDEDRKVAYETLNTGWVMWLRAKHNAKAQAVPDLGELQERIAGHQYYHDERGHMIVDMDDVVKEISGFDSWKAHAVPEWISVKDKLPEIGVYVMVFLGKQGHNPTTYNFCQYTKFGFHLSNVTHWMSLPDAPKPQEPAND